MMLEMETEYTDGGCSNDMGKRIFSKMKTI